LARSDYSVATPIGACELHLQAAETPPRQPSDLSLLFAAAPSVSFCAQIPSTRLGWLPLSDGTIGLAGTVTSVIGIMDTWPKANK